MTKLEECLYQYIAEERYAEFQEEEAYRIVSRQRDKLEERLMEGMTEEQKKLFNRYLDEENHIVSIHARHIFRETLGIIHEILHVSL